MRCRGDQGDAQEGTVVRPGDGHSARRCAKVRAEKESEVEQCGCTGALPSCLLVAVRCAELLAILAIERGRRSTLQAVNKGGCWLGRTRARTENIGRCRSG